jgi:hypothetical protein
MRSLTLALRRIPAVWRAIAGVAFGWLVFFLDGRVERILDRSIWHAWRTGSFGTWGVLFGALEDALHDVHYMLGGMPTFALLVGATLAIPLAALGRMVARSRVRAGFADPPTQARAWSTAHPRVVGLLLALPALLGLLRVVREILEEALWRPSFSALHIAVVGGALGVSLAVARWVYRLERAGLAMALTPTVLPEPRREDLLAHRADFDAVAVTTESRAAVVGMALLPIVVLLVIQLGNLHTAAASAVLGTYVALAAWGAHAFRRASKVTIGVDGVFVTGSSRTRFLAYKHLDEAKTTGSDLELCLRGKVVLRLQLHGEDARHRDAILARLQKAIESAKAGSTDGVAEVVATASDAELARLATAGGDYRAPAVTREQLWSVVEGSKHDATARTQAARALASRAHGKDLARLRVAAEHCAEPKMRVLLRDLAVDDEEDESSDDLSYSVPTEGRALPIRSD